MFENIGVVVPVRLGSSRVKEKAILPFSDTNLLEWKIRQLKEIALANGVQVHNRDFYLADGHKASFSEVITGIVKDIPFEHIAWVTAVVPLMSPEEYKNAFETYIKSVVKEKTNDSLFSANLLKEYFWDEKGPINYEANKNHTVSQDLDNIYRVTNGLYMRDKKSILEEKYFLGKNPCKFIVSKVAGVDIDEMEDYLIAKNLLSTYEKSLSLNDKK